MNDTTFEREYSCPWCGRGKVLADELAAVRISTQCPRCSRIFITDLLTGKTRQAKPQRKQGGNVLRTAD